MKIHAVVLLLPVVAVMTACAGSDAREPVRSYDRTRVGEVQRVERAEIVSLTPVSLSANESRLGTVIGAVAGGLAGRQVGGGSGRDIMTVIGAVAGATAGSRMRDGEARADAVEIGLEMEDGSQIAVVQELEENETFEVGDEVRVRFHGNKAEVMH